MKSETFNIKNENGEIRGRIVKPESAVRHVAICLHGGPGGDLHGNTSVFDQMAERLSALGVATIQFSFFGAPPSDGTAKDTCLRTQLVDYKSVIEYATKSFSAKIHVVGESAGATIASQAWDERVASYVLLWPAFDLKDTDLGPYLTTRWWQVVDSEGFLDDNGVVIGRELFTELLLTDFSDGFQLPGVDALLAHGKADREVPYEQSIRALRMARGRTTFISLEDADHGFKDEACRRHVLDAIEWWFRQR